MKTKRIFLFLIFFIATIYSFNSHAIENGTEIMNINGNQEIDFEGIINSSSIFMPKIVPIGEEVILDIKDIDTRLSESFENQNEYYYKWDIYNRTPLDENATSIRFDTFGEKNISLNIYNNKTEQTLLYSKDYSIFVYESSVPLLLSEEITDNEVQNYYKSAENIGIYIYNIGTYSEEELDGKNIISQLENYKKTTKNISNYLHIWGEKEFLLSAISQIGSGDGETQVVNYALTSPYNANILHGYLRNSLAGKDFIETAFILDESTTQRILKNPSNIKLLLQDLNQNGYEYTSISDDLKVSPILFVSKFVNSLSQAGVSTSDLYIILLLPFFLTIVAVAKHLIGLSTLGSIIPVFIAILFIKIGIFFTLSVMVFLIVCNIFIAVFLNKYTLLYTPKVACITITNVIIFMIFYQYAMNYELIQYPINNILYVIIFFIIAEKLITVITSKEFREYKKSLSGTLIVSATCALMYFIDSFVIFITAYPELILLLIPFNFFLGRFTGLRITEYLRFREISKNIEE